MNRHTDDTDMKQQLIKDLTTILAYAAIPSALFFYSGIVVTIGWMVFVAIARRILTA